MAARLDTELLHEDHKKKIFVHDAHAREEKASDCPCLPDGSSSSHESPGTLCDACHTHVDALNGKIKTPSGISVGALKRDRKSYQSTPALMFNEKIIISEPLTRQDNDTHGQLDPLDSLTCLAEEKKMEEEKDVSKISLAYVSKNAQLDSLTSRIISNESLIESTECEEAEIVGRDDIQNTYTMEGGNTFLHRSIHEASGEHRVSLSPCVSSASSPKNVTPCDIVVAGVAAESSISLGSETTITVQKALEGMESVNHEKTTVSREESDNVVFGSLSSQCPRVVPEKQVPLDLENSVLDQEKTSGERSHGELKGSLEERAVSYCSNRESNCADAGTSLKYCGVDHLDSGISLEWSNTLSLRTSLSNTDRLLVVANRLPMTVCPSKTVEGEYTFSMSSGGLVSGLRGIKGIDFIWIGWPGGEVSTQHREYVTAQCQACDCHPVYLDQAIIDLFYNGFCNNILWPLIHYIPPPIEIGSNDTYAEQWNAYYCANVSFVEAILEVYDDNDLVWVHDYHLMLVPKLLRARKPYARIGWFLHTPFPSQEIFRMLPYRTELLTGLLSANLIGFHVYDYLRHFINSCVQLLGLENTAQGIDASPVGGVFVYCAVIPIGIESEQFTQMLEDPGVKEAIRKLNAQFSKRKVILGVDRLDYMKGLPHKLNAFDRFLELHPEWNGCCVFVQLAVPSRTVVPEYQRLKSTVHELVGMINGKRGNITHVPVHYLDQSLSLDELVALYRVADVALISSIRDGMNLVAYEYIACQADKNGVLILSEFTGAAQSLGAGSIRINPWNLDETAHAIYRALTMSKGERCSRHQYALNHVRVHTSQKWAEVFIESLRDASERNEEVRASVPQLLSWDTFLDRFSLAQRRLILIDLVDALTPARGNRGMPMKKFKNLIQLSQDVLEALSILSGDKNTVVIIFSTHPASVLQRLFSQTQLCLAAEKGCVYRTRRKEWVRYVEEASGSCKENLNYAQTECHSDKPLTEDATFHLGKATDKTTGANVEGSVQCDLTLQTESAAPKNVDGVTIINTEWMPGVKKVFEFFERRTPGSYTERTTGTLTWYWDDTLPDFGKQQSRDLLVHLSAGPLSNTSNSDVEVVVGSRFIEVRSPQCSRSRLLQHILETEFNCQEPVECFDFVVSIANFPRRDEDIQWLFEPQSHPRSSVIGSEHQCHLPHELRKCMSQAELKERGGRNLRDVLSAEDGDSVDHTGCPQLTAQEELEIELDNPVQPTEDSENTQLRPVVYSIAVGSTISRSKYRLLSPYHVQALVKHMARHCSLERKKEASPQASGISHHEASPTFLPRDEDLWTIRRTPQLGIIDDALSPSSIQPLFSAKDRNFAHPGSSSPFFSRCHMPRYRSDVDNSFFKLDPERLGVARLAHFNTPRSVFTRYDVENLNVQSEPLNPVESENSFERSTKSQILEDSVTLTTHQETPQRDAHTNAHLLPAHMTKMDLPSTHTLGSESLSGVHVASHENLTKNTKAEDIRTSQHAVSSSIGGVKFEKVSRPKVAPPCDAVYAPLSWPFPHFLNDVVTFTQAPSFVSQPSLQHIVVPCNNAYNFSNSSSKLMRDFPLGDSSLDSENQLTSLEKMNNAYKSYSKSVFLDQVFPTHDSNIKDSTGQQHKERLVPKGSTQVSYQTESCGVESLKSKGAHHSDDLQELRKPSASLSKSEAISHQSHQEISESSVVQHMHSGRQEIMPHSFVGRYTSSELEGLSKGIRHKSLDPSCKPRSHGKPLESSQWTDTNHKSRHIFSFAGSVGGDWPSFESNAISQKHYEKPALIFNTENRFLGDYFHQTRNEVTQNTASGSLVTSGVNQSNNWTTLEKGGLLKSLQNQEAEVKLKLTDVSASHPERCQPTRSWERSSKSSKSRSQAKRQMILAKSASESDISNNLANDSSKSKEHRHHATFYRENSLFTKQSFSNVSKRSDSPLKSTLSICDSCQSHINVPMSSHSDVTALQSKSAWSETPLNDLHKALSVEALKTEAQLKDVSSSSRRNSSPSAFLQHSLSRSTPFTDHETPTETHFLLEEVSKHSIPTEDVLSKFSEARGEDPEDHLKHPPSLKQDCFQAHEKSERETVFFPKEDPLHFTPHYPGESVSVSEDYMSKKEVHELSRLNFDKYNKPFAEKTVDLLATAPSLQNDADDLEISSTSLSRLNDCEDSSKKMNMSHPFSTQELQCFPYRMENYKKEVVRLSDLQDYSSGAFQGRNSKLHPTKSEGQTKSSFTSQYTNLKFSNRIRSPPVTWKAQPCSLADKNACSLDGADSNPNDFLKTKRELSERERLDSTYSVKKSDEDEDKKSLCSNQTLLEPFPAYVYSTLAENQTGRQDYTETMGENFESSTVPSLVKLNTSEFVNTSTSLLSETLTTIPVSLIHTSNVNQGSHYGHEEASLRHTISLGAEILHRNALPCSPRLSGKNITATFKGPFESPLLSVGGVNLQLDLRFNDGYWSTVVSSSKPPIIHTEVNSIHQYEAQRSTTPRKNSGDPITLSQTSFPMSCNAVCYDNPCIRSSTDSCLSINFSAPPPRPASTVRPMKRLESLKSPTWGANSSLHNAFLDDSSLQFVVGSKSADYSRHGSFSGKDNVEVESTNTQNFTTSQSVQPFESSNKEYTTISQKDISGNSGK